MATAPPEVENQTIINWLMAAVTALVGGIASRLWTRVEVLQKVSNDAAASYVPRVEMQKYLDDLRLEMQRDIDKWAETALRMHTDNLKRFDRLDDAIIRVANRLDV